MVRLMNKSGSVKCKVYSAKRDSIRRQNYLVQEFGSRQRLRFRGIVETLYCYLIYLLYTTILIYKIDFRKYLIYSLYWPIIRDLVFSISIDSCISAKKQLLNEVFNFRDRCMGEIKSCFFNFSFWSSNKNIYIYIYIFFNISTLTTEMKS
jgi:hypothetical protein